jgi:hypothetical protein
MMARVGLGMGLTRGGLEELGEEEGGGSKER